MQLKCNPSSLVFLCGGGRNSNTGILLSLKALSGDHTATN